MITLSKLARLANVSVSTASKAFSMSREVSEETREMIFAVAREQGCFKKFYNAKYPKLVIAVVCPEFDSSHYSSFIACVKKILDKKNCEICVAATDFSSDGYANLMDYYSKYSGVDGMIVFDNASSPMMKYDIPVVYVGGSDRVHIRRDIFEGINEAVSYLAQRGVTEIGFIGERLTQSKFNFFKRALSSNGLELDESSVEIGEGRFEENGYNGMKRLCESGKLPRAVMCAYDNIAVGAMRYLQEQGIRIPEQVAIIGMDDISICKYLSPTLSSVDLRNSQVAEYACEEIVNTVMGLPSKKIKTVKSSFVCRESSKI